MSYAQALGAAVVVAVATGASADRVFVGSIGDGHSASATFGTLDDARNPRGVVPQGIFVRIENTINNDFDDLDSRILTGIFFTIEGCSDLGQYIDYERGLNGFEAFAGEQVGYPSEANPLDYWAWRGDIGDREGDGAVPENFGGPRYGFGAASYGGIFGMGDVIGDYYADPDGPDGGVLSPTGDPLPDMYGEGDLLSWRSFIQINIFLTPDFFYQCGDPEFASAAWQFGEEFSEAGFPADPPVIPLPTGAAMGLVGLGVVVTRRRR